MKLTKKQRGGIYLEAAKSFTDKDCVEFACNMVAEAAEIDIHEVDEKLFPELFMFRESQTPVWLSTHIRQMFSELPRVPPQTLNTIKQTVLLLSYQMCQK